MVSHIRWTAPARPTGPSGPPSALARGRDRDDADDLVQETLKRALVYIKDGRQIRDLRA